MADKLIAVEFDASTGESVTRELTADEIAERKAAHTEFLEAQEAKEASRQSALAKLAALGLTEAEIAAL
jgi:hypothetical protein